MGWDVGDVIVKREILKGTPWLGQGVYVVEDSPAMLGVFVATGSELAFGDWPHERWGHPWKAAGRTQWSGNGKLMLQPVGRPYSVDVFWQGPERRFESWYINLQAPYRRHEHGFDTLDMELDLLLVPDPADPRRGTFVEKDTELFEERVAEGRYSEEFAARIRQIARDVRAEIEADGIPVDPAWIAWEPPAEWGPVSPTPGWESWPTVDFDPAGA